MYLRIKTPELDLFNKLCHRSKLCSEFVTQFVSINFVAVVNTCPNALNLHESRPNPSGVNADS